MTIQPPLDKASPSYQREGQVDSVVWGAFFIWIGVGMFAAIPWGWFLVGIGALIGVAQLARTQMGLKVEPFWTVCGAIILAAGFWDVLRLPLPLGPVLLIALGVALVAKTVVGETRNN